jgi:hypothetical protein
MNGDAHFVQAGDPPRDTYQDPSQMTSFDNAHPMAGGPPDPDFDADGPIPGPSRNPASSLTDPIPGPSSIPLNNRVPAPFDDNQYADGAPPDQSGQSSSGRHRRKTSSRSSGLTGRDLIRLIVNEEMEAKDTRIALDSAYEQLERETRRADDAEQTATKTFTSLRRTNEAKLRAQQELAALNEELRLHRMQLERAQQEIYKAQEVLDKVEVERESAEADAAKARTTARKLREQKIMWNAREQGRQAGFQEGLDWGRRMGMQDRNVVEYEEQDRDMDYEDADEDYYDEDAEEEERREMEEQRAQEEERRARERAAQQREYAQPRQAPNIDFGAPPPNEASAIMAGAPYMAAAHAEIRSPPPEEDLPPGPPRRKSPNRKRGGFRMQNIISRVSGRRNRRYEQDPPPDEEPPLPPPPPPESVIRSAPVTPRTPNVRALPPEGWIPRLDDATGIALPPPFAMGGTTSPRPPPRELAVHRSEDTMNTHTNTDFASLRHDPREQVRVRDFGSVNAVPVPTNVMSPSTANLRDRMSVVPELVPTPQVSQRMSIAPTEGGRSMMRAQAPYGAARPKTPEPAWVDVAAEGLGPYPGTQQLADQLRYSNPDLAAGWRQGAVEEVSRKYRFDHANTDSTRMVISANTKSATQRPAVDEDQALCIDNACPSRTVRVGLEVGTCPPEQRCVRYVRDRGWHQRRPSGTPHSLSPVAAATRD